ncbi:MAG: ATPase [Oscillatoriales cyanobacterium RM2_1_1]|nr:ATPase [Oscillatoriales cyanobacterium SM2_3_0]NJO44284.1 ATPase [Oscillatoriales cyanobacterium RM2_1_1]
MTAPQTICLGFLAVILVGTVLLLLPFSRTDVAAEEGFGIAVVTALFTMTSGVCVTGLSVVDVGTYYSFWGQLILLSLIQVGALGYMTANTVLLLLIGRRMGLKSRVALQQTLDIANLGGVMPLLRSIIATTVLFQLTGIILLMTVFTPDYGLAQGLWLATFHSVNAFDNAGFSLFPTGLVAYVASPLLNGVVTLLIIFGGLGYQVIIELYLWLRHRLSGTACHREFSLHFKIVTSMTWMLLLFGMLMFLITEFNNPATLDNLDFSHKLLAAWFQSVTSRTAGFNTIDIGNMARSGLFLTAILMFIGASPGSTGGGVKTTTLRVLINCTKSALQGRDEVLCYQRKIPDSLILKAVGVILGSAVVVCTATFLVSFAQQNLEFGEILFEVVSAFATVGLSTGITAKLTIFSRLVIIVTMYIGRVGVLLLMLAFFGDPKPSVIDYPEENLLVG